MAETKYINIQLNTAKAERNAKALDKDMKQLGRDTDKTTKSMSKMSGVATAVISALSGYALANFSDKLQLADNQLKNVTKSTKEYADATERLRSIAFNTRQDISDLTSVFARFKRAGEEAGFTQEQTLDLTESLTKAFKIEGNTVQEVNSVLLQLTQSFRSGRIAGEEFRAVSEGSTIVLQALAKQLNVTTGELKDLASKGLVTPEALIKGLEGANDKINKEFSSLKPTFAEVGASMGNAFAIGFTESGVTGVLNDLKTNLIGGFDAIAQSFTEEGKKNNLTI